MLDPAARKQRNPQMLAEVRAGLNGEPKQLSPKFFYDARGSELFEEITRLPEYYLTRTERVLLADHIPIWIDRLRPRTLVELGAGSAAKTRLILDAMRSTGSAERYVPVDVSASFLEETAAELRREYPALDIVPAVADITTELNLPRDLARPVLFSFLGSTIGNFERLQAVRLLKRIRAAMQTGDCFLLGADLRPGAEGSEKTVATIEAAYCDAQGLTAEFNRNMLRVLNRELGANFDPLLWQHRAFYNEDAHCIEMHLVSPLAQAVAIPGMGEVVFKPGESIRTEISCKYDRATLASLFEETGLAITEWQTDADGLYALLLGTPTP